MDYCSTPLFRFSALKARLLCSNNKWPKKRRGISEVIATLLLVGVTVVGGALAMVMVNSFTDNQGLLNSIQAPEKIALVGYDTRDGPDLSFVSALDNDNDSTHLCTSSCSANPDRIPSAGGTEFILLTLHNSGSSDVTISQILVSNQFIAHSWDGQTADQMLSDSSDNTEPDHKYPAAGKFSIIDEENTDLHQHTDSAIPAGQYVRAVIKLSSQISPDIDIDDTIPIIVSTANGATFNFNIEGGSVA